MVSVLGFDIGCSVNDSRQFDGVSSAVEH
jgi:hypothetical protein